MITEGESRIVRQSFRGRETFVVVWMEDGIEQHRDFDTIDEATDWQRVIGSAASPGAPAASVNPAPVEHSAPVHPNVAVPANVQIVEEMFRGTLVFVVKWSESGHPHSARFDTVAQAAAEYARLRAITGGTNGHGHTHAHEVNGSEPAAAPTAPVTPRRILVVCPDPDVRARLIGSLFQLGHHVDFEADETRALEAFQRTHPDVVMVPFRNPRLSGLQICRSIKKTPAGARVDVVLIAPRHDPVDEEWGLKQGAKAFLTEPFTSARINALFH